VEELLLDDGIQLHPLEDGSYRARWTVRGGALFFGGTTKPPVQTEGLEERSTLWVAGAGFEPTTFGLWALQRPIPWLQSTPTLEILCRQ
jgi:hypothetical protein